LVSLKEIGVILNPSNPPSGRYASPAVFVPSFNSMFLFGGYDAFLNELWQYTISNNSWVNLNPGYFLSSICVSSSNSMIIFVGCNSISSNGSLNS